MSDVNSSETAYASAARTATPAQKVFANHNHRGVLIVVDVTAIAATPSVTPQVYAKDEAGNYDNLLWQAAAAITNTGQYRYMLYPGASDGNCTEVDGIPIPLEWALTMLHGDADSITYSVRVHAII